MKTLITKAFNDIHQAKSAPASPGYFHDFPQFIKCPQDRLPRYIHDFTQVIKYTQAKAILLFWDFLQVMK